MDIYVDGHSHAWHMVSNAGRPLAQIRFFVPRSVICCLGQACPGVINSYLRAELDSQIATAWTACR